MSFPSKIWFDLSFFRVAWWINFGVNTAVTQMSLHVEYLKWIQGPRVVCGLVLAVKPSTHPLIPSSLRLSRPLHHFYSNSSSPQACSFSALLCSRVTALFSVFSAVTSSLWSLLRHSDTPHPAPTWWWQDCSDRKPSFDKTEASWATLNSSQMLVEKVSPLGSPVLSLVKESPDVSCVLERLRILYEHLRMLDSQHKQ